MICKVNDLKDKQVVCVKNGAVIGTVSDVEFNTEDGKLSSIIIYGKHTFLGLFGKENDIIIPWNDIEVIGNETILVKTENF